MISGQSTYLDCGVNSQFSRSLAAAIAVVMMIAAFGLAPGRRQLVFPFSDN